jgi:hypothetical protein
MSPEELTEIAARANAATPGSWEATELPPNELHRRPAFWVEAEYHEPSGTHTKTVADVMWSMEDAEFIAHAREDVPALLAEVKQLRAQMDAVEKFVAARAEYITAINNCHPDNSHDYWRWQGHAEGRRQLSQALGLPVAWPADGEG